MSDAPSSGFGKFVPGFEFLQNLAGQAAGGVAQGISQNIPQLPNLGNWVAPTFNVEDLEKRIEELKAVHFWLDQNAKALGATIQALEVQKMTLSTLKTMNFSMGDVANALKIKAADKLAGFTGSAAPAPSQFAGLEIPPRTYGAAEATPPVARPSKPRRKSAAAKAAEPAASGGVVDPMQWWGALSQQFQQIASNAMKDVARQTALDTTRQVATGLTDQALKTATGMAGKAARGVGRAAARAVGGRPGDGKVAPKRAPAAKPRAVAAKKVSSTQPLAAGDWTLPNAFFPGLAPAVPQPVTRKTVGKKPAARKAPPRKTSSRR
ncbi:PhaM family polyhydroxyalkanoate granule multifunctional regulatory protein [Hydrogenophaga laconesensis]|uniref:Transcriptional regulator n=1 Tax=Hydrogenophaga laconesensis TaxID=1805971 RepID=A0ABU1V7U5_9BURK|nr:PhaM family polyhydroxyalkanoate granule multifunctional regulatory protein [Hydrogenophaga laconesensis]MDR7093413.1 hypothetical protein [Hydrogenophaga laconesensis]